MAMDDRRLDEIIFNPTRLNGMSELHRAVLQHRAHERRQIRESEAIQQAMAQNVIFAQYSQQSQLQQAQNNHQAAHQAASGNVNWGAQSWGTAQYGTAQLGSSMRAIEDKPSKEFLLLQKKEERRKAKITRMLKKVKCSSGHLRPVKKEEAITGFFVAKCDTPGCLGVISFEAPKEEKQDTTSV